MRFNVCVNEMAPVFAAVIKGCLMTGMTQKEGNLRDEMTNPPGIKIVSFVVVAESLCGATVTLFDLLKLKDTVLDTNSCESTNGHDRKAADILLHPKVVFAHARSKAATFKF